MSLLKHVEYHSDDFDFEEWRLAVESEGLCLSTKIDDPCNQPPPCMDSEASGTSNHPSFTDGVQAQAWDAFHQQHQRGTFFKERRYLLVEFDDELAPHSTDRPVSVLEIGCGSGSSVLPLLNAQAVQATQEALAVANVPSWRYSLFVCDVATQQVSACLSHALTSTPSRAQSNIAGSEPSPSGSIPATTSCDQSGPTPSKPLVDHLLMVFVLSAVHPQDCIAFLRNACEVLREGGRLLLRDYGLYDMTMLRFPKSQYQQNNVYIRQDGTISRFFTKEDVKQLCADTGLLLVGSQSSTAS